eukprot:TRINITY_DN63692_c0_g1_i1.p1 TRINITY_DN63692_c0_g1~~TRINITY_DN63692_c0_g1_i1.p1  ORF type:complete len:483 (+),score=103.46 TRINITY_DN63692_c0_g1_i1:53-1501(+)
MAPMLRALLNDGTSCPQQLEALTRVGRTHVRDVAPCHLQEVLLAPKALKHSSFLSGPEAFWPESAGRSAGWPAAFGVRHARPPHPVHESAEAAAGETCVAKPLHEVPNQAKCEHARCDLRQLKNCTRNHCCKVQHTAEPAGHSHGQGSGHVAAPMATPAASPEVAAHGPAAMHTAPKKPAPDLASEEKSIAHVTPKDPAAPEPSKAASATPELAPQQVQTQHAGQTAAAGESASQEAMTKHPSEEPDMEPAKQLGEESVAEPAKHPGEELEPSTSKHPAQEPAREPSKHPGGKPAVVPATKEENGQKGHDGKTPDKVGSVLAPACCLCNNGEVTWTQTGHCSHCDDKGNGAAQRLEAPLSCQPGSESWPMDAEKGWTDEDDSMGRICSETCREIFQADKSAAHHHHQAIASMEAAVPRTATSTAESVAEPEEEAAVVGAEDDANSAEAEAEDLAASPDVVEPALTTSEQTAAGGVPPTDANA